MSICKVPLIIFVFSVLLSTEKSNRFGFIFYNSNKWDNSFLNTNNHDIYNNGLYTIFDFNLGPINLYNSIYATTDSTQSNRGGTSKPVSKFFGFSNRAFMKTTFNAGKVSNNILFGRDYISIGNGYFDQLFISKNSRPFDQIFWSYNYKDINGSSGIIQLNPIGESKRYLSFHTFGIKKNNFSFTIAEAILFTGVNRTIDWQLINPVLMWLPEMHNDINQDGNAFIYTGFSYKHSNSMKFWMDILIDDFQLIIGDWGDRLEPNNYGILIGVEKLNWILPNSTMIFEYTLITNQTYQTHTKEEKYIHRGYPIGHNLGNDFDLLSISLKKNLYGNKLKPFIYIGYLRDGANGIEIPYQTPWEFDENLVDGIYKEERPTRPIKYKMQAEISSDFVLNENSWVNFGVIYRKLDDLDEIKDFSIIFRFYIELNNYFKY